MISEAPYSTNTNGFRMVNKSSNARSLSLIRDHGRILLNLVRYNEDTYV